MSKHVCIPAYSPWSSQSLEPPEELYPARCAICGRFMSYAQLEAIDNAIVFPAEGEDIE